MRLVVERLCGKTWWKVKGTLTRKILSNSFKWPKCVSETRIDTRYGTCLFVPTGKYIKKTCEGKSVHQYTTERILCA